MEQTSQRETLGILLHQNRWAKLLEIVLLFCIAIFLIEVFSPMVEGDLIKKQMLIWLVNVIMICWVLWGMKLRGESLKDFGFSLKIENRKSLLKIFLWSLVVFVLAALGFVLGSIIMANITGVPEQADFSGYDYFQNNLLYFLLSLAGIYIVSSFGEELVYRAFLINRISELGLSEKWGRYIAVILSSIIFGLVHYQWGAMGIVQTAFMGLALGICYLWLKKKLIILVLAHVYMDTFLMLQLYLSGN